MENVKSIINASKFCGLSNHKSGRKCCWPDGNLPGCCPNRPVSSLCGCGSVLGDGNPLVMFGCRTPQDPSPIVSKAGTTLL